MFNVTNDDISQLHDEDVRELVGRLCEAELSRSGLTPLHAKWGGDQNASDGGVDVRVDLPESAPMGVFARRKVVYQVKATETSPSKILDEMRPNGVVRPAIAELAGKAGSYIIVCSRGSASDTALNSRRAAMATAVADLPGAIDLHLEYYDSTRLATWVREHSSVVLWVRERIGRPISGWRAYDDWAGSQEGVSATYLTDDHARIHGPSMPAEGGSILEGLAQIRNILASAQGVVRLIGLSGVGKTRFVQALFDRSTGLDALEPAMAIYTDTSYSPNPQPVAMAEELLARRRRQVLIVDNCGKELHSTLAKLCRQPGSCLSLITVEYDVQDDLPEGTDVFELQPSSDDLIEKLLGRRVPGLSQVNAQTIAEFAGGNARVALALAHTVGSNETLSSLRDVDLFTRLFQQRNEYDRSVLRSAQALSIAYSFQGEDLSIEREAELPKLAAFGGVELRTLQEDIAEFKRRDLIQQRGVWRAMLPHAIANRLAATALENIPAHDFEQLIDTASPRLLQSISRRLGYLHTSPEARSIVTGWLAEGGLLGQVERLNQTGRAMLRNVAPVVPESAVEAIERGAVRARKKGALLDGEEFRTLLLSLAFDAGLFDRSTAVLLDLIEPEKPGPYANQVRNSFQSLFHLHLSGTHATIEQRCRLVGDLLNSTSEVRREIGLKCLEAMLQTSHFSSSHTFAFGGRSRDYGWYPRTRAEAVHWFRSALALCTSIDASNDNASQEVRSVLGSNLRGMWTVIGLHDEIEAVCLDFQGRRFWPEGWAGIRSIRRWRDEPLPPQEDGKLAELELLLSPQTLSEKIRVFVLCNVRDAYNDIDFRDMGAQYERKVQELIEIGKEVASDRSLLDSFMSELILCKTGVALGPFAKGLVDGTLDRQLLWGKLVAEFRTSDPEKRSIELLACYLWNLQSADAKLTETLLRDCLNDALLAHWFPELQLRVDVTADGVERLKASLGRQCSPAHWYRRLAFARSVDDAGTLEMVRLILHLEKGFDVALDIVHMRLQQERTAKTPPSKDLITAGRLVIEACDLLELHDQNAYAVEDLVVSCLNAEDALPLISALLDRFQEAGRRHALGLRDEGKILGALFAVRPRFVLDKLFATPPTSERGPISSLFRHDELAGSPLGRVPPEVLIQWCNEDSTKRYPLIASKLHPVYKAPNSASPEWRPIALTLLENAPNKTEVLQHYIARFQPTSWTGLRSVTLEANTRLLDHFENHADASLVAFVKLRKAELAEAIHTMRQQEHLSEQLENQRFE